MRNKVKNIPHPDHPEQSRGISQFFISAHMVRYILLRKISCPAKLQQRWMTTSGFVGFFLLFFTESILIHSNDIIKFHKYFFEYFKKETFRAEFIICNLLEETLINKDINYLVAPWAILQRNSILGKKPNLNDIPNIKLKNAFAVCSHDDYNPMIPILKRIGVQVLFAASATNHKIDGIDVVSIPYFARNASSPAKTKNIFYSFVGTTKTHKLRKELFTIYHPKDCVLIKRDQFHYSFKDQKIIKEQEKEYAKILSSSRFSLCPRGRGANSYRFWESLKAGAIPVLISDEYILPPGYDWSKCIIRIREKDIYNISHILHKITKNREEEMRKNCYIAYSLHSGKNFARIVRNYFKK